MRQRALLLAGAALLAGRPAHALNWQIGEVNVSLETTLSVGTGIRTSDLNPYFLDPARGGTYTGAVGPSNLNWPKGSVFQVPLRGTNELEATWQNYTAFVRATYLFDPLLSDPYSAANQPLPTATVGTVGRNFRLLAGFVRGTYDIADERQTVTLGYQTFNWGESTFLRNGLNAINAIDAAGIHFAGADLRSLYLPAPSIDLRTTLPWGLSLEVFNQFVWTKTQLDPYGSFFSIDTPVAPGARGIPLAAALQALGLGAEIPRRNDRKASDGGNFGVALRKTFDDMDGASIGLYFENYGSRFPIASFTTGQVVRPAGQSYASTTSVYAEYPNHIQTWGASFSGSGPWGSALQGEVSYTPNQPLQINAVSLIGAVIAPGFLPRVNTLCRLGIQLACLRRDQLLGTTSIERIGVPGPGENIQGYARFGVTHLRLSDAIAFGAIAGTPVQNWGFIVEYGMDVVNDYPDPDVLPLFRPLSTNAYNAADAAFFTNGRVNRNGMPTQFSQGIVGRANFSMPALLFHAIDVAPSLAVEYDFQGTTPAPLATFDENVLTATVGVTFSYLQRWQANVSYTSRYGVGGNADYSAVLDRDYVSLSASYRF